MIVRHPPFNCLVCRKLLSSFTREQNVGDELFEGATYEVETYSLCEWCGAAYLISRSRNEIHSAEVIAQLHPKWAWKLIPDALLPTDIRDIQSLIRATPATASKGGSA